MFYLNNRKNDVFDKFLSTFERDFFDTPNTEKFWSPHAEIRELEDKFLVSLDVPGVKKEEVHVEINDNTLVISGERKFEKTSDDDGYHRTEKRYGSFKRAFTLPSSVDKERSTASYEDGVLEIELAKSQAEQNRKITIK
jgi:HSP20 family protein